MSCPSCGGYSFDDMGRCRYCGVVPPADKPKQGMGKVDAFYLGRLMKKKREGEQHAKKPTTDNLSNPTDKKQVKEND